MGEIETEHNRHQRTSNFLKAFIDQYTFEKRSVRFPVPLFHRFCTFYS